MLLLTLKQAWVTFGLLPEGLLLEIYWGEAGGNVEERLRGVDGSPRCEMWHGQLVAALVKVAAECGARQVGDGVEEKGFDGYDQGQFPMRRSVGEAEGLGAERTPAVDARQCRCRRVATLALRYAAHGQHAPYAVGLEIIVLLFRRVELREELHAAVEVHRLIVLADFGACSLLVDREMQQDGIAGVGDAEFYVRQVRVVLPVGVRECVGGNAVAVEQRRHLDGARSLGHFYFAHIKALS